MRKLLLLWMLTWMAIGSKAVTVTDTIFDRKAHEEFAFGADVSFVPMMESWNTKWLDKYGKQKDILQILKEQGINSIRLRVWTVASGASSKQEVVSMCRRAKAKGMNVMIDFHYSDTWADPGKQEIPKAWTDHSVNALAQKIYDHTYDVLSAIKRAGVTPKWVQVGNETKRGMLYPVGQTNKGGSAAFAKFVLNGYNAVKAVDSSIQVIVHLPDGHDNGLYRGIFDGLKRNGAKWDIIGLSAYPRWSHLDGPTMITKVMANINDLKKRYGTPCMVVETGHYPNKAVEGNQYLVGVMDRMIKNGDLGCFYWEPESMGGYELGAWDEATQKPTVMMDAFLGLKHTEVPWLIKANIKTPSAEQTVDTGDLLLEANVQHIRPGQIKSVGFFFDRMITGTYTIDDPSTITKATTIPMTVKDVTTGVHTAWARVIDISNNIQYTDTVTFFAGKSTLFNGGTKTADAPNDLHWNVDIKATGKYLLAFKYTVPTLVRAEVKLNGEKLNTAYFYKKTNDYRTVEIDVKQAGQQVLQLSPIDTASMPEISLMRIFPLDGQEVPTSSDATGISIAGSDIDEEVGVYSLSGVLLYRTTQSELGVSLNGRSSAVMVLPGSSVSAPVIVRCLR